MYWWLSVMPTLSEILEMTFRTSGKSRGFPVKEQDSNQMPLIIRHETVRRYFHNPEPALPLENKDNTNLSMWWGGYERQMRNKGKIILKIEGPTQMLFLLYVHMSTCPHMHPRTCRYLYGRAGRNSQHGGRWTPGFGSGVFSGSALHDLSADFSVLPC